jgi:hypothetical protein
MKAQVKVTPSTIVEVEGGKQKDLFKAIASAQEVFGEKKCGLCGSENIRTVWRTVTTVKGKKTETFEFPEYRCQGKLDDGKFCNGKLSLGTINDDTGTLYPQRRLLLDDRPWDMGRTPTKAERDQGISGDYGRHNGWTRYRGKPEEEAA